jgi:tape measure domain-containing protein
MDNLQAKLSRTDAALASTAGSLGRMGRGFSGIASGAGIAGNALGALATKAVAAGTALAAAYVQNMARQLSDEYSQTRARIDLMNDGLQTTAQLQNMIFQSAMNARGNYQTTADAAAKMGVLAGEAFSGNRELVAFMEQINKQFAISGTSAVGIQAAMLQLTQAMGAGALRGEELNSVLEQAPTIVKTIAKYMKVSTGELRELASEGKVTASIVKAAMLAAADETNATFEKMPVTFSQAFTMAGNVAYKAFTPVWEALGRIANNKNLDSMLNRIYPVLLVIGTAIAGTVDGVNWLAGTVVNVLGYAFGWTSAIAIIGFNGITAAIPFVLAVVLGLAAGWAVLNAGMLYNAAMHTLVMAYIWGEIAVMAAANAIMAAYRWAILAVAAAKMSWTIATGGATIAQTLLAAATWALGAPLLFVAAVIVGVVVAALALWGLSTVNLRDVFADAMDFMIDACEGGVNTMARMINGLVDIINKAAGGLNSLFGTNIGTLDHVGTVDFQGAKKWSGYMREGTFMENLTGSLFGIPEMSKDDFKFDPANAETAKNTKGIKDALGILDEDIKYMRDIADREYISQTKYSTVKIDMSGMSTTVHNKGDLDGYIDGLGQYMQERMANAVEGAHEE